MQLFSYQQGGITLIQARLTLDQNHFFKTKYKRILNYYYYTKIFKAIAKYKTSTIFFTAVHQFKIKRPQCIAVCQVILDLWNIWAHLIVPVLLDFKLPLPLQDGVAVVVCELTLHCVWPPHQHTRGGLIYRGQVFVGCLLGSVAPNHELWFVNCQTKIKRSIKRFEHLQCHLNAFYI